MKKEKRNLRNSIILSEKFRSCSLSPGKKINTKNSWSFNGREEKIFFQVHGCNHTGVSSQNKPYVVNLLKLFGKNLLIHPHISMYMCFYTCVFRYPYTHKNMSIILVCVCISTFHISIIDKTSSGSTNFQCLSQICSISAFPPVCLSLHWIHV